VSAKISHERRNARRSAGERAVEEHDGRIWMAREGTKYQNADELAWLTALLDKTESEFEQAAILRSIEWLKENPDRSLYPSFRSQFLALERRLAMQARGVPIAPRDPSKKGYNAGANRLRRLAAIERKKAREATIPDWMKDPSKLPKKPPSKPSVGE